MKKNNKYLFFYYLGLLLVMLSWKDTENAPNLILRIGFLLASAIPAFVYDKAYIAPIMICFTAITQNGFAHSYMPDNQWYYIALLSLGLMWFQSVKNHIKVPTGIIILFIYITLIDIVTSITIEKISLTFIVSFLLLLFTSNDSEKDANLWSLCFVVTSVVLSSLFLINRQRFTEMYYTREMERTAWMDPNYFGMVVGMGFVVSLLLLMNSRNAAAKRANSIFFKALYIATIILSAVVLVLNASRGSLLAAGIAAIVAVSSSKVKIGGKFVVVLLMVFGLIYMYQNSYFDLLEYRIENDHTEGGNGRYYIWQTKLSTFFQGNPLKMIFGYGHDGGLRLGYGNTIRGTHNDFVSFLVEYGFIGLGLFIYMLLKPLFNAFKRSSFVSVLVLLIYLSVCCLSLEPITGAYIPYLFFYFYILLLSSSLNKLTY